MDPFWNRVFENLAEDEAVHSKRLIYPAMTSFTRFPQLPVELQLMIWEFYLPPPRIVVVDESYDKLEAYLPALGKVFKEHVHYVCSGTMVQEFRPYQECFHGRLKEPVWFDVNRDILLMHSEVLFRFLHRVDLPAPAPSLISLHIRFLAISLDDQERTRKPTIRPDNPSDNCLCQVDKEMLRGTATHPVWKSLREFRTLEQIFLIRWDSCGHKEELESVVKVGMRAEYKVWENVWRLGKREALYLLPKVECLTRNEFIHRVERGL